MKGLVGGVVALILVLSTLNAVILEWPLNGLYCTVLLYF